MTLIHLNGVILLKKLYDYIAAEDIDLIEDVIPGRVKGLYFDNVIVLHKGIETDSEKHCILAEELGHHFTSSGVHLDQKAHETIKQEKRARHWAYKNMLSVDDLIDASRKGIRNRFELAEHFGVTERFLDDAIEHLIGKYGQSVKVGKHVVYFEPLGVLEMF